MKRKSHAVKRSPPKKNGRAKKHVYWRWLVGVVLLVMCSLWLYWLYLQAEVTRRFNGARFTEPASVYARPLSLQEGQRLSVDDLVLELQLLGYRATDVAREAGEYVRAGNRFAIHARPFQWLTSATAERALHIVLRDGYVAQLQENEREVNRWQLDPVLLGRFSPRDAEDRELVTLKQLPPMLINALLATEDRDFYSHHGFSAKGILRAFWQNLRSGEVEQGGSTITQQLIKNYFLTQQQNIARKVQELMMAVVLEVNYSKDEILQSYLNEVYFGQDGDRAIHGVGLASRYFFGKPVAELNVAESALLVALIKGPSVYSPWKHPQRARERRDLVLQLLSEQQHLSASEKNYWQEHELSVLSTPRHLSGRMPAVLDLVKREWQTHLPVSDSSASGWRVFTSIDPVLQRKTELVIERGMARLDATQRVQAAAIVSDRHSGFIRAIVAGRDSAYAGFNRALDAKRPVGSLLKPFIYYTALQNTQRFSLASPLQDTAFVMRSDDGRQWQPKNYDGSQHGNVMLQFALSQSLNLATSRLAMEVGLNAIEQQLKKFGLERAIHLYPSLALGALELSPLQVANLYSGLAHGQRAVPLRAIEFIRRDETVLYSAPKTAGVELASDAIFLTDFVLQEVVRSGTGKALGARFPSLGLAGKTGTTNDKRDSWFAGFDDEHLAVFWMGRDDNAATEFSGASGALVLFSDFIAVKPERPLSLIMPRTVKFSWLSPQNGDVLSASCEHAQWLPVSVNAPSGVCE